MKENKMLSIVKPNEEAVVDEDFNDQSYSITYLNGEIETVVGAGFEMFPGVNTIFITTTKDGEEYKMKTGYNLNNIKKVESLNEI